jgi:hypothetical protein
LNPASYLFIYVLQSYRNEKTEIPQCLGRLISRRNLMLNVKTRIQCPEGENWLVPAYGEEAKL